MKRIIFLALLLIPMGKILASDADTTMTKQYKVGVAIVPQYAITGTMRMDIDITLKNNNVLTLSPMFSFARNSSLLFANSGSAYDSYYYDDVYPQNIALTGGGLKVKIRHFFGDFNRNSGLYAGGGLHYRYSHVSYTQEDWVGYVEDGFNYMAYGDDKLKKSFNQGGLDVIFGYQLYLLDNIYGDFFAGWGFRLSDYDEVTGEDNYWSETIFDLGYSGYTPLMGLRIGVLF